MNFKIILVFFLTTILIACNRADNNSPCENDNPCPHLSIYDADITDIKQYEILEKIITQNFNDGFYHVVQESFRFSHDSTFIASWLEQNNKDLSLLNDIALLNANPRNWGDLYQTNINWFNNDQFMCLFGGINNPYQNYYDCYEDSKGLIQFTQPLIFEDDKAIVSITYICDWLCGYGYVAYLEKNQNVWEVINFDLMWIS